jgi:hypothetical protein
MGVLFIRTQQVQPSLSRQQRQSQQAWIISQHLASPLVQVMQTPLSVISHLHMPIVRLQQYTVMPLSVQQQVHMPPCNIEQRFCTMLHAILSSQEQVSFIPPWHFSTLKVQRGTINQLGLPGIAAGLPIPGVVAPMLPMPGMAIPVRSIIIVEVMVVLLSCAGLRRL